MQVCATREVNAVSAVACKPEETWTAKLIAADMYAWRLSHYAHVRFTEVRTRVF